LLNVAKIEAAARAVPLTTGRLIDRTPTGACYCVVGALLHAAGVSDDQLEAFDRLNSRRPDAGATAQDVLESEFARSLCDTFGHDVTECLDSLEDANDYPTDVSTPLTRVLEQLDELTRVFNVA